MTEEPVDDTELGLTQRLLALLKAKEDSQIVLELAQKEVAKHAGRIEQIDAEAAEIKRRLGASAKGRRRANPTCAATSADGSLLHAKLKPMVEELMKDLQWRFPKDVAKELKTTLAAEKQIIRQIIRNDWQFGRYERRRAGTLNTGRPSYEYRLKS